MTLNGGQQQIKETKVFKVLPGDGKYPLGVIAIEGVACFCFNMFIPTIFTGK